jgi:ferredoxin
MADPTHKVPENVPGPWYVDDTCTPCRTCLDVPGAEELIRYDGADEKYVYFHTQPSGDAQIECANEMMAICPQAAIGSDGE